MKLSEKIQKVLNNPDYHNDEYDLQEWLKEATKLEKSSEFLRRLEDAGVDNWQGYYRAFGDEDV